MTDVDVTSEFWVAARIAVFGRVAPRGHPKALNSPGGTSHQLARRQSTPYPVVPVKRSPHKATSDSVPGQYLHLRALIRTFVARYTTALMLNPLSQQNRKFRNIQILMDCRWTHLHPKQALASGHRDQRMNCTTRHSRHDHLSLPAASSGLADVQSSGLFSSITHPSGFIPGSMTQ